MRKCPVKGCGCKIADRMFVCNFHWHRLPEEVRNLVSETFREYIAEEISLSQLRQVTNQVLADYHGVSVDEVEELDDYRLARVHECHHCGKTLVCGYEEDAKGGYVIIGGVAKPAQGKPAIYTRFSMHACQGLCHALRNVKCTSSTTATQRT